MQKLLAVLAVAVTLLLGLIAVELYPIARLAAHFDLEVYGQPSLTKAERLEMMNRAAGLSTAPSAPLTRSDPPAARSSEPRQSAPRSPRQ
jgi:hypothetical protein